MNTPHVALVISPLRSLMHDQLQRCTEMGIAAVAIGRQDEMTLHEKQGKLLFQLIVITHESCNNLIFNLLYHELTVTFFIKVSFPTKKHLKNVRPIRHNEPPHAHSPDVARRLCIDVHNDDDNAWQRDRHADPRSWIFFVKLHIIFALKYNKQQLLLLLDKITFIILGGTLPWTSPTS